jgi:hypothetical protein
MEHEAISSTSGQQPCQNLLGMPQAVLARIAQLCNPYYHRIYGHPMLRLSRGGRDAVLSNLKMIRLFPYSYSAAATGAHNTHHKAEATGRLLHRACCQVPAGLEVDIHLSDSGLASSDYFSTLLQPGIRCGGWHHVHSLKVRGVLSKGSSCEVAAC